MPLLLLIICLIGVFKHLRMCLSLKNYHWLKLIKKIIKKNFYFLTNLNRKKIIILTITIKQNWKERKITMNGKIGDEYLYIRRK